ncbi:hypothetical protein AALD22_27065, partial [Lachnospiraceae bacterium 56-18]
GYFYYRASSHKMGGFFINFFLSVRAALLAAVCDTLSAAYHLLFSAGLSECRFSVPAPISGGVVPLTLRKKRLPQNHIPFSQSFSCNRHLGSKKAGTQMRTNSPTKG